VENRYSEPRECLHLQRNIALRVQAATIPRVEEKERLRHAGYARHAEKPPPGEEQQRESGEASPPSPSSE